MFIFDIIVFFMNSNRTSVLPRIKNPNNEYGAISDKNNKIDDEGEDVRDCEDDQSHPERTIKTEHIPMIRLYHITSDMIIMIFSESKIIFF